MNRAFVADALALILFFTATGVINEHFIAGMAWGRWRTLGCWARP